MEVRLKARSERDPFSPRLARARASALAPHCPLAHPLLAVRHRARFHPRSARWSRPCSCTRPLFDKRRHMYVCAS
eukprot:1212411-Pleurochrysis_carterae.AAC.6